LSCWSRRSPWAAVLIRFRIDRRTAYLAVNSGRVHELPGPATPPKSDQTNAPARPIDTSDLTREPVTQADRADEKLVETTDIPIGDLRELAIRFQGLPADTPLQNCTALLPITSG